MTKYIFLIALLAIVAFFAAKRYNYWPPLQETSDQTEPAVDDLESNAAIEEPVIHYPVPAPKAPAKITNKELAPPIIPVKPLPLLNESDKPLAAEINKLVDKQKTKNVFLLNAIIPRFVVTVDNLTQRKLSPKYNLSKPPPGPFLARKDPVGIEYIDPKNYPRYAKYLEVLMTLDSHKLVAVYVEYYPLFQQAYDDLGYPSKYFNDRLIEVIDHLLETPDIKNPIKLNRPNVFYKFDNPRLEQLSAGQKILIRMGNSNAKRVKEKIQELRRELTNLTLDL